MESKEEYKLKRFTDYYCRNVGELTYISLKLEDLCSKKRPRKRDIKELKQYIDKYLDYSKKHKDYTHREIKKMIRRSEKDV